jgi:hypothetical protein
VGLRLSVLDGSDSNVSGSSGVSQKARANVLESSGQRDCGISRNLSSPLACNELVRLVDSKGETGLGLSGLALFLFLVGDTSDRGDLARLSGKHNNLSSHFLISEKMTDQMEPVEVSTVTSASTVPAARRRQKKPRRKRSTPDDRLVNDDFEASSRGKGKKRAGKKKKYKKRKKDDFGMGLGLGGDYEDRIAEAREERRVNRSGVDRM